MSREEKACSQLTWSRSLALSRPRSLSRALARGFSLFCVFLSVCWVWSACVCCVVWLYFAATPASSQGGRGGGMSVPAAEELKLIILQHVAEDHRDRALLLLKSIEQRRCHAPSLHLPQQHHPSPLPSQVSHVHATHRDTWRQAKRHDWSTGQGAERQCGVARCGCLISRPGRGSGV